VAQPLLHGDVTTSRFTRKKCHEFIAVDAGVSAVKKVDDLLRVHPFTKADQAGQNSELPNRHRLAIPKTPASALDGRPGRRSVRKVIAPGKLVWTGTA
jgi:hypothetical protein